MSMTKERLEERFKASCVHDDEEREIYELALKGLESEGFGINEALIIIADLRDQLAAAQTELEALRKDKERLERALERIGFYFYLSGNGIHQHIADKVLLVLRGKTIDEACKDAAIASGVGE